MGWLSFHSRSIRYPKSTSQVFYLTTTPKHLSIRFSDPWVSQGGFTGVQRDNRGMSKPVTPDVECEQHHSGLAVTDVAAAVEFYTTKLGFQLAFTDGDPP